MELPRAVSFKVLYVVALRRKVSSRQVAELAYHVDIVSVVAVLFYLEPVAVDRQKLVECLVGKTSDVKFIALSVSFIEKKFYGRPYITVPLRISIDIPLRHAYQQSAAAESYLRLICFAPYKEICETVIRTMAAACANLLFYTRFIF